jgi:hypothetical protein
MEFDGTNGETGVLVVVGGEEEEEGGGGGGGGGESLFDSVDGSMVGLPGEAVGVGVGIAVVSPSTVIWQDTPLWVSIFSKAQALDPIRCS